jgi:hypothetical protein
MRNGGNAERAHCEEARSMDIAQIALLVGAANLVVLTVGVILALFRSVGRRRGGAQRSSDRRTQHSAN